MLRQIASCGVLLVDRALVTGGKSPFGEIVRIRGFLQAKCTGRAMPRGSGTVSARS